MDKTKYNDIYAYREQYKRCSFCEYLIKQFRGGLRPKVENKCEVKQKLIKHKDMPRPWCKWYIVGEISLEKQKPIVKKHTIERGQSLSDFLKFALDEKESDINKRTI